jgi:photosystem II stability/assembly factor-like uncharacterized protein
MNFYYRPALLALFTCFLLLPTGLSRTAKAQNPTWQHLPESPASSRRHDDVEFIDEMTGWVVNGRGEVHKTMDGGQTWQVQIPASAGLPYLRAIAMANETKGWIGTFGAGSGGVLWETRDGGAQWTNISNRIKGVVAGAICGLWAVNDDVAYGVGAFFGGPWFIKTKNGGINWSGRQLSGNIKTLVDVYFQDENTGFIVGGDDPGLNGNAVVLKSTDAGASWQEVYHGNSALETNGEWGWKISFPTENVGYVSVEYNNASSDTPAKILKTTDGGETWSEILIPGSTQSAGLQGIGFLTPDVGWATGRGTTSMTLDGGLTWAQVAGYQPDSNPDGGLDGSTNRIHVINSNLAYAVGQFTYKFEGSTPVHVERAVVDTERTFTMGQNFPNPFDKSTTIKYTLYRPQPVHIRIIDMVGRTVRTLVTASQGAGTYSVTWDGTGDNGVPVASGSYVYMSDIGESFEVKRMILIN